MHTYVHTYIHTYIHVPFDIKKCIHYCVHTYRGLFEGKVGNLWCAASVKPFSIRERIPVSIQPLCALSLTLCMVLPFCILLFNIGRKGASTSASSTMSKNNTDKSLSSIENLHLESLLWGTAGSSLSFFLASYQVHEKSILLPLAPLSLLVYHDPTLIHWFAIVSIWSMWHLLVVDRLQVPYFALITIYICYVIFSSVIGRSNSGKDCIEERGSLLSSRWDVWDRHINKLTRKVVVPISSISMIVLHILEYVIPPPTHLGLPDLFPVLWVIGSCTSFCFMWIISLWKLTRLYAMLYQSLEFKATKMKDE